MSDVTVSIKTTDDEGEDHVTTVVCGAVMACAIDPHILGGESTKFLMAGDVSERDVAAMLASLVKCVRDEWGETCAIVAFKLGMSKDIIYDPLFPDQKPIQRSQL